VTATLPRGIADAQFGQGHDRHLHAHAHQLLGSANALFPAVAQRASTQHFGFGQVGGDHEELRQVRPKAFGQRG